MGSDHRETVTEGQHDASVDAGQLRWQFDMGGYIGEPGEILARLVGMFVEPVDPKQVGRVLCVLVDGGQLLLDRCGMVDGSRSWANVGSRMPFSRKRVTALS